ncbi:MAG: 23S rRNA (adenine(2503)-C(2))-methyltransferase RlmN [Pseudomonadota bacterium]
MDLSDTPPLVGLSSAELSSLFESLGQKAFRGRQVYRQIQKRGVADLESMTDLPGDLRARFDRAGVTVRALTIAKRLRSTDGTEKLALETRDGRRIETVLIPMENGTITQCLSSQVGCAMGCTFCLTGQMGLLRNLTPGEIVDQHHIGRALSDMPVRNLVFMGMGEPLQNFDNVRAAVEILEDPAGLDISHRRITLSTCGVVPGIRRMAAGELRARLAISLNAPIDAIRSELMPINRRWPLDDLLAALKEIPLPDRDRHTFEYVLLADVNDQPEHARALVRLLSHLRSKINLIVFNEVDALPFSAPSAATVETFRSILEKKQLTVTVRASKGRDILAACGQLATPNN